MDELPPDLARFAAARSEIEIASSWPEYISQTQRAKVEQALDASRLVWWEWDLPSDLLCTHAYGKCILGYTKDRIPVSGQAWLASMPPDDAAVLRSVLAPCLEGSEEDFVCEHRYLAADGQWRWVVTHGRVIARDSERRAVRMLGTTQDIHARREDQERLRLLSSAVAQIDTSVLITDTNGVIRYVNPHLERTTGYSAAELLGQRPARLASGLSSPGVHTELWDSIRRGESWTGELVNRRKSGEAYPVRVAITPVRAPTGEVGHYIAVEEDLTAAKAAAAERERLAHQLAESQKMETLGTLAGGVAHEFNNLLTAIIGFAELARGEVELGHPAQESLRHIEEAGHRAADLVRRILAFSRRHDVVRTALRVEVLVQETLPLLRAVLPSTIALSWRDRTGGASVRGDAAELQQVLLNLCTNAAHAIGRRAGRIEIEADVVQLATPLPVSVGEVPPGRYARIVVADDGAGMDPGTLARIFEPFFTTKPPGEGTGLGLAIVHNAVRAHQGALRARSTSGQGTQMEIFLPLGSDFPGEAGDLLGAGTAVLADVQTDHGERRVALVDDESSIAALNAEVLHRAGCATTYFSSAEACLDVLRRAPSTFDLIITDQTMPGMTGSDLLHALRREGCSLPVLLVSGIAREFTSQERETLGPVEFLAKPFTLAALSSAADRLLRPKSGLDKRGMA